MSAVRQAVASAFLFLLVAALIAAVAFTGLRGALTDRIDAALDSRADDIVVDTDRDEVGDREHDEGEEGGREELIERIAAAAYGSPANPDRMIALVNEAGRTLSGPVIRQLEPGRYTTPLLTHDGDDSPFRVLVRPLGEHRLIVAESLDDVEEVVELVTGALLWGGLAAAVLTLFGGLAIGIRAQRRISAMEAGLDRVAGGDFSARVPAGWKGDDIDRIAASTNSMLDRLQASVDALRDLSVNIAHDLKTPIARLHSRLSDMRNDAGTVGKTAELDEAIGDARRIGETFDAILRISQIEAGSRRERFTEVNLGDVARRIDGLFRAVAEETGRSLTVTADRATVLGDAELLVQMSSNLVANALNHTPAGTAIDVVVEPSDAGTTLSVWDRGPGIPEDMRSRVFDRFYRLDPSRSSKGTGLGLALVKAIADLHGAGIRLGDNRPGLRVEVRFPAPA